MKTKLTTDTLIFVPNAYALKPPYFAKMYSIPYCKSKPCANYK